MLTLFALGFFTSMVIAYLGRKRRMGFWGLFFCSLLFSPVIGFLIFCVTEDVPVRSSR